MPAAGWLFIDIGSQVKEYERVGQSVFSVCKKAQMAEQLHFMSVKWPLCSGFVILFVFCRQCTNSS